VVVVRAKGSEGGAGGGQSGPHHWDVEVREARYIPADVALSQFMHCDGEIHLDYYTEAIEMLNDASHESRADGTAHKVK